MSPRHFLKLAILAAYLVAFSSAFGQPPAPTKSSHAYLLPDSTYLVDNMQIDPYTGIAVAIYGVNSRQYSGSLEQVARQYLLENKTLLGMADDLADLRVIDLKESLSGHHVGFRQFYQDIPVWQSEMVVSINKGNQVVMLVNHHKPGISVSITPSVSDSQALAVAEQAKVVLVVKTKNRHV